MKKVKVNECPYRHEVTDYQDFTVQSMSIAERRRLDVGDIWSNKIQCKLCGWYIRSKNRHDFRQCKCGACFIDGGSWYSRIGGDPKNINEFIEYYYEKEE